MISLGSIKQGDTFALYADIKSTIDDSPVTGAATKLKSQVRTELNVLSSELAISETEQAGTYLLRKTDDKVWVVGTHYLDIQYTNNGVVTSTETMEIQVVKDVTV